MRYHTSTRALSLLGLGALSVGAFTATPAIASARPGASAFASAEITSAGGSVSGFGITATFAAGAVTHDVLAIIGSWPNGLDVMPPIGHAVKTFGLQVCDLSTGTPTNCTSEFGNYLNSTAGTERVNGQTLSYTGSQSGVNFGTLSNKLVSFTIDTGASAVYIYNPNATTTAAAYPKLLPSTTADGTLTFKTFQPIVWTLTSPS